MAFIVDREAANRDALKACALLGGFFVCAVLPAYLYTLRWSGPIPRDGTTLVVGRDFLNFWMYGRAAALPDPGRWYDPITYQGALTTLLGPGYPGQNWSYPPSVMLLAAPFGKLDYLAALGCWTATSIAVFVSAAARQFDGRALIAALCAPAAIFCVICGQYSLIVAAMMLAIFSILDSRPLVAGLLIGLLTIKPQVGILFPVMLVASGRYRAFAAASITALALVALSAAMFGPQMWIDFIVRGLPVQNYVLSDPEGIATPFFPTVFANLRGIGATYPYAMAAQIVTASGAVGLVGWAFRTRANADPLLLPALFFACSAAASPYLLSYDTLPLCLAALSLLAGGVLGARGRVLARLAYWLPLIQMVLGKLYIPGPALIAPAFAVALALQLKDTRAPESAPNRSDRQGRSDH